MKIKKVNELKSSEDVLDLLVEIKEEYKKIQLQGYNQKDAAQMAVDKVISPNNIYIVSNNWDEPEYFVYKEHILTFAGDL